MTTSTTALTKCLLALAACSALTAALADEPPLGSRADVVFDHPEWIGQDVVVDVYEPLYDSEHMSGTPKGHYSVQLANRASLLVLAPGPGLPILPKLTPPFRVRGKLSRCEYGRRVNVREITPLSFPKPQPIANASEILTDRARWAGQLVEVEDDYIGGFEASLLGDAKVWLDVYPSATVRCAPKHDPNRRDTFHGRVRVVGFAYTEGHYGHLSRRDGLIEAIEMVYLDPSRSECR